MKKVFLLVFIFSAVFCFSQTLITRNPEQTIDSEYTNITENEFHRLVQQYRTTYNACLIRSTGTTGTTILDNRPGARDSGYDFATYRMRALPGISADERRYVVDWVKAGLLYGNRASSNGMVLIFGNNTSSFYIIGSVPTNSPEFDRLYREHWNTVTGPAQIPSLQRGTYQTTGYPGAIRVFPNMTFNNLQRMYVQQEGSYVIESSLNNGIWCIETGQIRGNQIHVNIVWLNDEELFWGDYKIGDFDIYTIVNATTFQTSDGDRWIWRQDIQ